MARILTNDELETNLDRHYIRRFGVSDSNLPCARLPAEEGRPLGCRSGTIWIVLSRV